MADFFQPHGLQHASLPYPSLSFPVLLGVCSDSCPLRWWCHPNISSSVAPFSSCLQSFPASGSFRMSWIFASGGQSIGASSTASVLSMNIQGWFPLGLNGLISLLSKELSRVVSSTRVWKQLSIGSFRALTTDTLGLIFTIFITLFPSFFISIFIFNSFPAFCSFTWAWI